MTIKSALRELNNATLDLQAADYNTYVRPLRKLASILASEELKPITDKLKEGIDFNAFLSGATRGSMAGSASLNWPTNRQEDLGLAIIIIERGAKNPEWFANLAFIDSRII